MDILPIFNGQSDRILINLEFLKLLKIVVRRVIVEHTDFSRPEVLASHNPGVMSKEIGMNMIILTAHEIACHNIATLFIGDWIN